jgi:hypothetical protein
MLLQTAAQSVAKNLPTLRVPSKQDLLLTFQGALEKKMEEKKQKNAPKNAS